MSEPITATLVVTIKMGLVAMISAIAGSIEIMLSMKKEQKVSFNQFVLFTIVHFVNAMIVGLLLKTMIKDEYVLFGLIGIGGLLGTRTMLTMFTGLLENILKVNTKK